MVATLNQGGTGVYELGEVQYSNGERKHFCQSVHQSLQRVLGEPHIILL